MQLTHTITMDPPFYTGFRLHEKGGPLDLDNTYQVGSGAATSKPVLNTILKKKFWESVYWEGSALIVRRVHELNDFELVMKRYLEENGTVIRLVSVHHNLVTNEEIESISFFTKIGPSPHAIGDVFPVQKEAEEVTAVVAEKPTAPPSPAVPRTKSVSFGASEVIN